MRGKKVLAFLTVVLESKRASRETVRPLKAVVRTLRYQVTVAFGMDSVRQVKLTGWLFQVKASLFGDGAKVGGNSTVMLPLQV